MLITTFTRRLARWSVAAGLLAVLASGPSSCVRDDNPGSPLPSRENTAAVTRG